RAQNAAGSAAASSSQRRTMGLIRSIRHLRYRAWIKLYSESRGGIDVFASIGRCGRGGPSVNRRAIGMLALAHVFTDLDQGVLPPLIPSSGARGSTIAAGAGLVRAATLSPSTLQPLFGQIPARRAAPWLVPAGLFFAGAGAAAIGLMPTYVLVLL